MTELQRALSRVTEAAREAVAHGANPLDLLSATAEAWQAQDYAEPPPEAEPLPVVPTVKPGLDSTPEAYNVGE